MPGQPALKDAVPLFGQGLLSIINEIVDLRTLLGQTVHVPNGDILLACDLAKKIPGVDPAQF
jgi:hypothetical protein